VTRPRETASPLFAALLFFGALFPRLYVALAWSGEPVWDGHYYDFGARRIAEGFGYSDDSMLGDALVWHPWCHYPVGYSAFLALFYRVFGERAVVAPVVNSIVGAAIALVVWLLARHALSEKRARLAAILVAANPEMILYAALLMTEPLAALLTLGAFWIAARDSSPRRGLLLGALVLGVGALVRPQALLCAPFLALVMKERIFSWISLRNAIAACAITLLPVLPWTARNCRVMDGCALVSTNAGWNLAIGAFPRATASKRCMPPTAAASSRGRCNKIVAGSITASIRSRSIRGTGFRSSPRSSVTRSIMLLLQWNISARRVRSTGRSLVALPGVSSSRRCIVS